MVKTLAKTLADTGFLKKAGDSKEYELGLWMIELGAQKMATTEINRIGALTANYLGHELDLTVRLGVLERDVVIVTHCSLYPTSATRTRQDLGAPLPAYCTAMGRAILAFYPKEEVAAYLERVELVAYTQFTMTDPREIMAELDTIRANGYAVMTNEVMPRLQAVGAPIFNASGKVAAAISLSGDPDQLAELGLQKVAKRIAETAGQISGQMGYFGIQPRFQERGRYPRLVHQRRI